MRIVLAFVATAAGATAAAAVLAHTTAATLLLFGFLGLPALGAAAILAVVDILRRPRPCARCRRSWIGSLRPAVPGTST